MSRVQEFDASIDLMRAILWQYDGAEKLKAIIRADNEWLNENQAQFWSDWYRDVFNLDTANEFGMSVWARILNIPLGFGVPSSVSKAAFGFGVNHQNFENGNFARKGEAELSLTLEQKRLVLKLRYRQLTTRPTAIRINEMLAELFADQGKVFVHDPLDMTYAVYFFGFEPSSSLRLVLEQFDLLPRPAAVGVEWQVQVRPSFGFGVNHLNFENGNFGD